jgi:integrase
MANIRLKFVNNFRDRHGIERHYFRAPGVKAVALPGLPGSEAFMAAYAQALAGLPDVEKTEIGGKRALPGTVDALCVSYYRSANWLNLAEGTRYLRRPVIERFRNRHGSKRVALLRYEHIVTMLAEIDTVAAKRAWLAAIRPLLQHAVPTMVKDDPAAGIAMPKIKIKGHHSWTDAEVAQYRARWPYGTEARLVLEFAFETVSRRGEIVTLGPQHVYTGEDGQPWIHIARTHRSKDVDIPISPELMAAIDAMPKKHLTFLVNAYGKPRSNLGLAHHFAKWARAAGLPDHCRLHGLKKAGMSHRADAGYTTHELMADSGHKTLAMVELYTKAANDKKLAASGAAKRTKRGAELTNSPSPVYKLPSNLLK